MSGKTVILIFAKAPKIAEIKKSLVLSTRSGTAKTALSKVPIIKPNCTEEVSQPPNFTPNSASICMAIALPESQRVVPANCAKTKTIKKYEGRFLLSSISYNWSSSAGLAVGGVYFWVESIYIPSPAVNTQSPDTEIVEGFKKVPFLYSKVLSAYTR